MQSLRRVLLDLGLLGVLSITIGFGVNAVRERGAIKPTKNYFEKSAQKPEPSNQEVPAATSIPNRPTPVPNDRTAEATTSAPRSPQAAKTGNVKHLQHGYQEIDFGDLIKVFQNPATAQGLNLFVDARRPDLYIEGHIPGAIQCDPYEPENALDGIVARANGVERVIVYCGGGDCEDSIFMCRELVEAGLPYDSVFLYAGGWTEWSANEMPAQMGRDEQ